MKIFLFFVLFFCSSPAYAVNLSDFDILNGTWKISNFFEKTIVSNEGGSIRNFDEKTVFLDCKGRIADMSAEMMGSNFTVYVQKSSNATSEEEINVQFLKIICE